MNQIAIGDSIFFRRIKLFAAYLQCFTCEICLPSELISATLLDLVRRDAIRDSFYLIQFNNYKKRKAFSLRMPLKELMLS